VRDDSLLIGLQTIDGLEAIFGREVSGFARAVMGPPVGTQTDDYLETVSKAQLKRNVITRGQ